MLCPMLDCEYAVGMNARVDSASASLLAETDAPAELVDAWESDLERVSGVAAFLAFGA